MKKMACTRMLGAHLVEGAGHWVQQEQPEQVGKLVLQFLHPVRGDNLHPPNSPCI